MIIMALAVTMIATMTIIATAILGGMTIIAMMTIVATAILAGMVITIMGTTIRQQGRQIACPDFLCCHFDRFGVH